jgi:hypothetical protein
MRIILFPLVVWKCYNFNLVNVNAIYVIQLFSLKFTQVDDSGLTQVIPFQYIYILMTQVMGIILFPLFLSFQNSLTQVTISIYILM